MTRPARPFSSRLRVGLVAALLCATVPLTLYLRASRGLTRVASGGMVALATDPTEEELLHATVRRTLAVHGPGTYIGEMLAERDSSLARWPDRLGHPLAVWIQPASTVTGWLPSYLADVRAAFGTWDALRLPVRFAFTSDSARADVHVTFIDRFDEPISGRTKWARDDDWWITDADIVLAVHHRNGEPLDDEAMRAMTMHEVGHLLGLDHTGDDESIMAPRVRVRALSEADEATVRLLYTLPPGEVR
jgi:hypothetical protein